MRNLLDLAQYEELTKEEAWMKYGWGCEAEGEIIRYADDAIEVFADTIRDYGALPEDVFACEIYESDGSRWDMTGQWFDNSYENAIRGAAVSSVVCDAMREEGNCEDAVNVTARLAYMKVFGDVPIHEMDFSEYDRLLGMARIQVRDNIKWVDYEWEEF